MLSVIGGLTVMLGSSPLAAQGSPSATRSFDSSTVAPGGMVTVTIAAAGYDSPGRIRETLPTGVEYVGGSVSGTGVSFSVGGSDLAQGLVVFNLLGASSFSYQVTASSTASSHTFRGILIDGDANRTEYVITGDSVVTVSGTTGTTPVVTPPVAGIDPAGDDLQFDVVPAKAVKGAVVSGLTRPIGSNPLQWEVDTGGAAVTIAGDGLVGDFRVEETSEGSGKFQLLVDEL